MTAVALFELVLALLGVALCLSLAAERFGFPPAAALVLGGLALGGVDIYRSHKMVAAQVTTAR